MNKDKALIKTFNYGKNEHLIVTDVEAIDTATGEVVESNTEINKKHNIKNNREITKNLIEVNKNRKLKELLDTYHWLFERFIEPVKIKLGYRKTITKKSHNLLKPNYKIVVEYWVKAYKVSKALLAYVTQAEETLRPHFEEQEVDERKQYSTPDIETVASLQRYKPRQIEVYNYDNKKHENVTVELQNGKDSEYRNVYYINNKAYSKRLTKFGNVTFSRLKMYHVNRYLQFKRELATFFESVNPNNDYDFDKYLNEEVRKLAKYFGNGELEKLQQEYNGDYK